MRQKRKITKRIMAVVLCLMMSLAMMIPVYAEDSASSTTNQAVKDARRGVVAVYLVYEDETGKEWYIQSGSGFLIGVEDTSTTVITNEHVVKLKEEDLEYANKYLSDMYGHEIDIKDEVSIKIVLKGDVTIFATYKQGSAAIDFAVLELEQPIGGKNSLTLATKDQVADVATQNVYALGFPATVNEIGSDFPKYTTEEINITSGTISKQTQLEGKQVLQHSCDLSGGNSGGPLVNEDGVVVGVNTSKLTVDGTNYNIAAQIDEITDVLDMLNIAYKTTSGGTAAPASTTEETQTDDTEVAEEPQADKSALTSAIAAAADITADGYTEDSYTVFEGALADANDINAKADATQAQIDDATNALTSAQKGLTEKKGLSMPVIIGIIVGAVVIIVIIVLIIVLSGKKKKQAAAPQSVPTRPTPNTPPVQHTPNPTPVAPAFTGSPVGGFSNDDGAGETSLLNDGAGETTLLSGQMTPTATLVRKANNETAVINKQLYRIGKEKRKVDFCISNNNSISRVHVEIVYRNGSFYIIDQNSSNFTFVNGNKIAPGQEVILSNGDKVKLSDEEFEFRA